MILHDERWSWRPFHACPRWPEWSNFRPNRWKWLFVFLFLSGCAQAERTIGKMDDFFDSLNNPPLVKDPYLITGPGYAPAYPPRDYA